jgi:hypothetical protein
VKKVKSLLAEDKACLHHVGANSKTALFFVQDASMAKLLLQVLNSHPFKAPACNHEGGNGNVKQRPYNIHNRPMPTSIICPRRAPHYMS